MFIGIINICSLPGLHREEKLRVSRQKIIAGGYTSILWAAGCGKAQPKAATLVGIVSPIRLS